MTTPWEPAHDTDDGTGLLDPFDERANEASDDLGDDRSGPFALAWSPRLTIEPRLYQRDALRAWLANSGRGVVVLPTGAGKTVLAFMAIDHLAVRTLIVVPTIDLLRQWRQGLIEKAAVPPSHVGVIGGGEQQDADITVITYDSAAMPRRDLAGYGLVVFDEVHHLPAPSYRAIAQKAAAPWRLGLTATPERNDGTHADLTGLVGPEVYRRLPADLAAEGHIARYREQRIFVDLTPNERYRYDSLMAEYRWYLASHRSELLRGNFFERLIRQSAFDPAARRALQAHREARLVALNAESKLTAVEQLLCKHADDKVLVFSEFTVMVNLLNRRLALPAITYRTDSEERQLILDRFRSGQYRKLTTGRVLNEGVDVPDANVAIVVSGSAATREYIQRLGRVLRPKPSEACLYEIISRETTESRTARARRPGAA